MSVLAGEQEGRAKSGDGKQGKKGAALQFHLVAGVVAAMVVELP